MLRNLDSIIERTEHGRLDTQLQDRPSAELRVLVDVVVFRHVIDIHRELTRDAEQRIARTNLVEERLAVTTLDSTARLGSVEDIVVIVAVVIRHHQVLDRIPQRTTLLVRGQQRQQAPISTIRRAQTRLTTTDEINRIGHRRIVRRDRLCLQQDGQHRVCT